MMHRTFSLEARCHSRLELTGEVEGHRQRVDLTANVGF